MIDAVLIAFGAVVYLILGAGVLVMLLNGIPPRLGRGLLLVLIWPLAVLSLVGFLAYGVWRETRGK